MKKLKKIVDGLKTKGLRNAPWDKLGKQDNGSYKKAPHKQMYGESSDKLKKKK